MENFTKRISVLLFISCLLGAKLLAQPIVTSPTVSAITHNSATLGGTISGAGITARGTSWKTSSPVAETDNQLAEGLTVASPYSHSRTSLPSGTKIFFVAYGTNAGGTAISTESSFFTLSNPPSGQPGSLTATVASSSQIDLAWPTVTADGFLIYRRAGATAPNVASIGNGVNPPAVLGDGSTLIFTATGAATSYNDNTGLSAGTQYSYTLVPFGYNGSNPETYNFLTTGAQTANATTFNSTSTITLIGGTTTNAIDYASFQTGGALTTGGGANSASLGRFIINDLGGDGQPTTLTSVTLSIANFSNLNQIAIFDDSGTNLGQQTVSGSSVTFSGLTTVFTSNNNSDNSGRFRIRATFLPVVTDNQQINIAITNVTALASGSGFASANAGGANTPGTNDIEVTATQLVFTPASLPNTNATANFAPLTIRALDALNNVDLDETGTVSLSITTGTGTLSATPSASGALVAGVRTWTNLSINTAGAKVLTAGYTGLPDPTINITILSNGVDVTPGTAPTMCYKGDFQNLTNIVLAEDDQADFGVGTNRTYSMILPTNFIFDTSVTAAPIVSGGSDISSPSALSYIGNDIVRFSYTITGTANVNTITIGGLKVKYVGNTPSSGNILRLGGSAVQVGNADTDGKNHGTLNSVNSGTTVDFTVATVPGEPLVSSTDTQFQVGINSVQLVGNPVGGIFSGPGVSPNATLGYVFSPSSVGVSTGNQITYTITETTGQHCQVSTTKTFDVFSSSIQNLQNNYCTNGSASPTLSVLPAAITNTQYGTSPPEFVFYDLVYEASPGIYNLLGTTASAGVTSIGIYTSCFTIPFFGTICFPVSYVAFTSPPKGLINTFDPKLAQYQIAQALLGQVRIYFRMQHSLTPSDVRLGSVQYVKLDAPPTVGLSIAKTQFCANESPITLFGTPPPSTNTSVDFFTAAGQAGSLSSSGSPITWTFNPSSVGGAPQTFDLTYTYRDPTTLCSSTTLPTSLTVHAIPTAMTGGNFISSNIVICSGSPIGTFIATPLLTSPNVYKWYTDAALTQLKQSGISYTPSSSDMDNIIPASTTFYATRTINGCESPSASVTMTVNPKPTVNAGNNTTICAGNSIDLTPANIGATIGAPATTAFWTRTNLALAAGTFYDGFPGNPIAGPSFILGTAVRYDPSPQEIANGSVAFRLTTNDPAGPCVAVFDDVVIAISPGATVNADALGLGSIQTVCAPFVPFGSPALQTIITLSGSIGGVPTATWSIVSGGSGIINSPTSLTTTYTSTTTESLNGATIVFKLLTADPDGTGPCTPISNNVTIIINKSVIVSAGSNILICNNTAINLNGVIGGSATSATWTGGSGTFSPNSSTLNAQYFPSPSEINGSAVDLKLVTNDPDGVGLTGPCLAESSSIILKVYPIPPAPLAPSPPDYCAGSTLLDLSARPSLGGSITWYSNIGLTTTVGNNQDLTPSFISNTIAGITDLYVTETAFASTTPLFAGCQGPATNVKITVHPLPVADFTVAINSTNFCFGSFMAFTDNSSIPPGPSTYSLTNWAWDFNDGDILLGNGTIPPNTNAGRSIGTFTNPQHKYGAINGYNISLVVKSNKGCVSNSTQKTFSVGPVPQTDFTEKDVCNGDVTTFTANPGNAFDDTTIGRRITTNSWTFGDITNNTLTTTNAGNPNISASAIATHTYTGVNTYTVSLTQTSGLGCIGTITKSTSILPYIKSFPYFQDFAGGSGGWSQEGLKSSSSPTPVWTVGTPNGSIISSGASGANAWYTSKTGISYNDNLRAILNGPCIDVTLLPRPVLAFKYFDNTDTGNDGAYVETSTNGGVTWTRFGVQNQGINWYDRGSIGGLSQFQPFGQSGLVGQTVSQIGWTGTTTGWTDAKIALDAFSSQTKLRFRIVFGTNADNPIGQSLDGFAIDDVELNSRNRILLIETFTNENASRYSTNDVGFKSLNSEVAKIQYHTSFPSSDSQSPLNQQDNNARAAFYGINSTQGVATLIPRSFIDGFTDPTDNTADFSNQNLNSWWGFLKSNRSLSVSPFSITITNPPTPATTPPGPNNQISVKVDIVATSALTDSPKRNLSLAIAIVEKQVGSTNTFVIRKLVPSPSGIAIPTPIASGTSINIPVQTTEVSGVIDPSKLAIVAFIQDLQTSPFPNNQAPASPYLVKEVMQAAILSNPTNLPTVITSIDDPTTSLSFYPIPADKTLEMKIAEKAKSFVPVIVYDAIGKVVTESGINEGQQTKTLNTAEWAGGVYIIQLETDKGMVRKKVMVAH